MRQHLIAEIGHATLALDVEVTGDQLVTIFRDWVNKVDPTMPLENPDFIARLAADAGMVNDAATTLHTIAAQLDATAT